MGREGDGEMGRWGELLNGSASVPIAIVYSASGDDRYCIFGKRGRSLLYIWQAGTIAIVYSAGGDSTPKKRFLLSAKMLPRAGEQGKSSFFLPAREAEWPSSLFLLPSSLN
jgi:hypothetical protein